MTTYKTPAVESAWYYSCLSDRHRLDGTDPLAALVAERPILYGLELVAVFATIVAHVLCILY